MLSALGHVHACAGRHADARLILHELEGIAASRYVSRYEVALVHLGLGEHDRALELLEMAYLERAVGMTFMGVEPRLDPLRPTAAFADLRRRVGI
jgi:serine/threonine-protein kinase